MRLAIKNARIVDPATGRDGTGDLYVADGKISAESGRAERTIDAKGLVAAPGFIDIAARLREPGFEYKATLESEVAAAIAGGVAHDGEVATRLGLPGIPSFAETIALALMLELVRATGARVHFCRLSTAGAVEMIRAAKREGLRVTCDVGIHHLHLSELDLGYFDANCRLEPPLRSQRDRDALARGLEDGAIDCACSDHTPVDEDGKHLPFAEAEPGATGLELLLPLTLKWGEARKLPLAKTLARITCNAAEVRGVKSGRLAAGAPADIAIFDPQAMLRVSPETLRSQGKNPPFAGYELPGRVRYTIVDGNVVYEG